MYLRRTIYYLIYLALTIASVSGQKIKTFRIDPSQAYGGVASDYFSSVEYIPLETTKESQLGFVYDYIITDSSIVVNDPDTKSVLFFSPNGRFITKVKDNMNELRIDKDIVRNKILLLLYNPATDKTETRSYSLNGKLYSIDKRVIDLSDIKNETTLVNEYSLKCNSCRTFDAVSPKDSTIYLLSIYRKGEIYKSFLPYNQVTDMAFCTLDGRIDVPQNIQGGMAFFTAGLDYSLYKLTKDTVTKIGRFIFPADRSISEKFLSIKNYEDLKKQTLPIYDRKMIRSVSNIFFQNNFLFFKVNAWRYNFTSGSASDNQFNFILDTISNKLVSIERITSDAKTYFLPFCETTIKIYGLRSFGGYLYTNISSLSLFAEFAKNKSRSPQYPPVLQEYFKTQSRKSNPVVVKMKLKE